jgi:Flp pilus assembly protein TadG
MTDGNEKTSGCGRKKMRSGGAMIEAVLVMPLIVMLGFGVIDYSYFFYLKNTLQGAAQAGARAAIPNAAVNSDVTGVVSSMLNAAGIASANYTLATTPSNVSGLAATTNITVTITATWGTIGTHMLSTSMGGIGNAKKVVGTAVMQKEP